MLRLLLQAAAAVLALQGSHARTAVQFGPDIPPAAQKNVLKHLLAVDSTIYNTTAPGFTCAGFSLCMVRGVNAVAVLHCTCSCQA